MSSLKIKKKTKKQNKQKKTLKEFKKQTITSAPPKTLPKPNAPKALGFSFKKVIKDLIKKGGSALGNYLAPGIGGQVGGALGDLIAGKLIGNGAYYFVGRNASEQIPTGVPNKSWEFTTKVKLGDVLSTTTFAQDTYDLDLSNPGLFEWPAQVLRLFSMYEVSQCVILVTSEVGNPTNLALGVKGVHIDYNPRGAPPRSLDELEEGVTSIITNIHNEIAIGVELKRSFQPQRMKYTDVNAFDGTPEFNSIGRVTVFTANNPSGSQKIGEVYALLTFKARIPSYRGFEGHSFIHVANCTTANPLSTTGDDRIFIGSPEFKVYILNNGVIGCKPPGLYLVMQQFQAATSIVLATGITARTNCQIWNANQWFRTPGGVQSASYLVTGGTNSWDFSLILAEEDWAVDTASHTFTGATTCDIVITRIAESYNEGSTVPEGPFWLTAASKVFSRKAREWRNYQPKIHPVEPEEELEEKVEYVKVVQR